jgi:hypothetical protein
MLMPVQYFHETRQVSPFEVLRQIHRHLEVSDGVLFAQRPIPDTNRMQDILDADTVNRLPSCIDTTLDILHREHVSGPVM